MSHNYYLHRGTPEVEQIYGTERILKLSFAIQCGVNMQFCAARYFLLYSSNGWTTLKRGVTAAMVSVTVETRNTAHCFDTGIRRVTVALVFSVAKFSGTESDSKIVRKFHKEITNLITLHHSTKH